MPGLHRPSKPEPDTYARYDHLPVQDALMMAWEDTSLSPLERSTLRIRVWGAHPGLARTLERYYRLRSGLPDPVSAEHLTKRNENS